MRRLLRLLAFAEPVTLAVLLLNVVLFRAHSVAQIIGPIHDACYLGVIVLVLLVEGGGTRTRLLALLPGIGGLLAERELPTPQ